MDSMAKVNLADRAHKMGSSRLAFHCPGCGFAHVVDTRLWTWNGDLELPTLIPSVLVEGGPNDDRCHSFIQNGRIQYLSDCTHSLANQTIDLPPWVFAE